MYIYLPLCINVHEFADPNNSLASHVLGPPSVSPFRFSQSSAVGGAAPCSAQQPAPTAVILARVDGGAASRSCLAELVVAGSFPTSGLHLPARTAGPHGKRGKPWRGKHVPAGNCAQPAVHGGACPAPRTARRRCTKQPTRQTAPLLIGATRRGMGKRAVLRATRRPRAVAQRPAHMLSR